MTVQQKTANPPPPCGEGVGVEGTPNAGVQGSPPPGLPHKGGGKSRDTRERRHTADAVVTAARTWIGTPYHHQASVKGIGADCLGLIRGVWRDLYGDEAERPPAYSRDWGEVSGEETLLAAATRHLVARSKVQPQPGDVLIFRMRGGAIAKHAAILATPGTMVHAAEHRRAAEVAYGAWWRRRLAAVFSFPGIER
jgi:NlpC/P60 family putative phage cell wall peptidase